MNARRRASLALLCALAGAVIMSTGCYRRTIRTKGDLRGDTKTYEPSIRDDDPLNKWFGKPGVERRRQ